jgi:cyclophilin family peptidyl-prolyl cis-trans isomerase
MKKVLALSLLVFSISATGCEKTPDPSSEGLPPDTTILTQETMQFKPEKGDTIATMETNMGDIQILLYTKKAQETVKNFIELSKAGKYEGVPFHRVIANFMIQGGDFENENGTGGYSYKGKGTTLRDEFGKGLTHVYGAVSMANAGPNTGGSQFFIVQAKEGTTYLDGKHAIFGFVYEGMDTVEKIAALKTDGNDRPTKEVVIEKVDISEY